MTRAGNLVGTSDARLRENFAYDQLGRTLVGGLRAVHAICKATSTAAPTYPTAVTPNSATGVEVLYQYDTDTSRLAPLCWTTASTAVPSIAEPATSYTRDGRGRTMSVSRQLAAPTWTSSLVVLERRATMTRSVTGKLFQSTA